MADSSLPFDPVFEAQLEEELKKFLASQAAGDNTNVANSFPSPSEFCSPPRSGWDDSLPEPEMAQPMTSVPQAPAPTPERPRAKSTGAETIVAKATAPAPAGVSKKIHAPRPPRAPASAPPSLPDIIPADEVGLTEDNYLPKLEESLVPPAEAKVRSSHYGAYLGKFKSSEEARRHRRHSRIGAKKAADTQRVKKFGRTFWVRRLYEAMIDVSEISDRATSIHRQRLETSQVFDPLDLEAAAHQVFDAALKVHESGWCHPLVYHKNVVRGKLVDRAADSLELRLSLICELLRTKKAMVDDAIRGGITLALLVDNPTARGCTKSSNDAGNEKKGHRLKVAKELETMESPEEQAEEGEEEGPEAQA